MNSSFIHTIIIIACILYQHQVYGDDVCASGSRQSHHDDLDYCSLDSIKPGGIKDCDRIRTHMIDYTPPKTSNKFTWKDYIGIVGSVATVISPLAGGEYVAFTNFFSNIELKYGLMNGNQLNTASQFGQLATAINHAIDQKVNLLKGCLETEFLDTFSDLFNQKVAGFITDLKIIYEGIEDGTSTLDNVEDYLDNLFEEMTEHAAVYSLTGFGNDYQGLKYEILAPGFDFFINIYSEYTKFYLSIKNAYCNDIEYQQQVHPNQLPGACEGDFNHILNAATTKIEIMQSWITHGVQRIYDELNKIEFLNQNCETSSEDMINDLEYHVNANEYISHIHAMNGLAEGLPNKLDIDDDMVCLYFKMGDDKWCESDYFLCETHSRHKPTSNVFGTVYLQERLNDACIDAMNDKACERQKKLKDEINAYHSDLKKKYVSPVDDILDYIDGVEFTDEDTNGVEDNLDDLEFVKLEGYQCWSSIPHFIDLIYHQTKEECRQICLDIADKKCIAFEINASGTCAIRGGQLQVPYLYDEGERDCYLRID